MAVMTNALVPALESTREAHTTVADRLRSDASVTPPGPYRQMLEVQVTDVQDHLQRIEHHVRELRPRGLLEDAIDLARFVVRTAVRATMLPLSIGSVIVTGMLAGRRPADERRLLKNAEEEYAVAARALAACRAGETIAEEVDDQAAVELLGSLRRQDEELMETLEDNVAQQARAVAAASNGHRRPQSTGEGPADAREEGTATREQDLPIPGFSQLSITRIQQRLRTLSQPELTVIEGYERAHANRPGVLNAIEQLRGSEPWTDYDTMDPDQITARLQNEPPSVARQTMEYEHNHRQREPVITAAQARIPM